MERRSLQSDGMSNKANAYEEIKDSLWAFFAFTNPVRPQLWMAFARAFSRCGWWPSMFFIALYGATWMFNWTVGHWLDGPLGTVFRIATWLTWGAVSCLAMGICFFRSWRNLNRLGAGAVFRPRLWFEMSALAWHAMFLGFVATVVFSLIVELLSPFLATRIWLVGRTSCGFFFVAFLATGILGYGLLLARWQKPPWGRAFECVHFFLPLIVGGSLIVIASDHWLIGAIWPNRVIAIFSGLLGIGIWAAALPTMGKRMEELESSYSPEPVDLHPEFN